LQDSFLQALAAELQETSYRPSPSWPRLGQYRNRDTGKTYKAHNAGELEFVTSDTPKYALLKGGWGGGKSVAGIIKALERLRRGCSGIMVSPDNPHFDRSLWMEFERWCPWNEVEYHNQTRRIIKFSTGAFLLYGGIENEEDWEGPNVNWAMFDEARKKKDPQALKVLMSRVRIMGPKSPEDAVGILPQLFVDTTPLKHWLFDYFGPLREKDPLASFKAVSKTYTLLTSENLENLDPQYVNDMLAGLTELEAQVNLEAKWADLEDTDRFLPSIILWDACREELPALARTEPMVLALDAGVSNDPFGMLGVTRHPKRHGDVAVRFVQKWEAPRGGTIDYQGSEERPGPERMIRKLTSVANIVQVCYDVFQLHDMAGRLGAQGDALAWFREFGQGALRMESDKFLLDLIMQRRVAHDGNPDLREHMDNADRQMDPDTRRLRIVKRAKDLKIDLAVCLSMGAYECLRLNL
jgi:hypothetical protein